jgi:hypothetical protein
MMTQLPPELAQVIGAMNTIKPVTPQGTPTVAAQVMQAAQPQTLSIDEMAKNAGIESMLNQQRQQQAMQQAAQMAQQAKPQGVEVLNPGNMNFAEGGIVGFSEGGTPQKSVLERYQGMPLDEALAAMARDFGTTVDEMRQAAIPAYGREVATAKRAANMDALRAAEKAMVPATPAEPLPYSNEGRNYPAPSAAPNTQALSPAELLKITQGARSGSGIASLQPGKVDRGPADKAFKEQEGLYGQMNYDPTDPRAASQHATRMGAEMDEFIRSRGGDPRIYESLMQQQKEFRDREKAVLDRREAERAQRAQGGGLKEFLLGARGRGFGDVVGAGAQAGGRFDTAMRQEQMSIEDALLASQKEGLKEQQLLALAKRQTDMGLFTEAAKTLDELRKSRNESLGKQADAAGRRGEAELRTATEMAKEGEANKRAVLQAATANRPGERMQIEAEYRRLLAIDPKAAEAYLTRMRGLLGIETKEDVGFATSVDRIYKILSDRNIDAINNPAKQAQLYRQAIELARSQTGGTAVSGSSIPAPVSTLPSGAQARP